MMIWHMYEMDFTCAGKPTWFEIAIELMLYAGYEQRTELHV